MRTPSRSRPRRHAQHLALAVLMTTAAAASASDAPTPAVSPPPSVPPPRAVEVRVPADPAGTPGALVARCEEGRFQVTLVPDGPPPQDVYILRTDDVDQRFRSHWTGDRFVLPPGTSLTAWQHLALGRGVSVVPDLQRTHGGWHFGRTSDGKTAPAPLPDTSALMAVLAACDLGLPSAPVPDPTGELSPVGGLGGGPEEAGEAGPVPPPEAVDGAVPIGFDTVIAGIALKIEGLHLPLTDSQHDAVYLALSEATPAFERCVVHATATAAPLAGDLTLGLDVVAGRLQGARVTGGNLAGTSLDACARLALGRMRWPAGIPVELTLTLARTAPDR